ncbi:MAG: hypothetical protein RLZZ127_1739 [Planctomycetota bacterium]|jgi:hypothetical protein
MQSSSSVRIPHIDHSPPTVVRPAETPWWRLSQDLVRAVRRGWLASCRVRPPTLGTETRIVHQQQVDHLCRQAAPGTSDGATGFGAPTGNPDWLRP